MAVNKYDPAWQLTRTKARAFKNPKDKIEYVLNFYKTNTNAYNYVRVSNWLKTTAMAYKDQAIKDMFDDAQMLIDTEHTTNDFTSQDNQLKLSDMSTQDLLLLHKDLSKRKYGFQFKTIPKDHITFMKELENELRKRST